MLKLLSLDGGGVRGLIALYCLAEYERKNNVRVPDVFNCYSGTSVGAIIIAFFAYLKWSAIETLEYLKANDVLNRLMPQSKWDKWLGLFQFKSKYSDTRREALLKELFGEMRMKASNGNRVLMTGYNLVNNETIYFTSNGEGANLKVCDAILISSSAPFYFPSVQLETVDPKSLAIPKPVGVCGVDGGLVCNNPSDVMVLRLINEMERPLEIRVVSIGTGYVENKIDWSGVTDAGLLNPKLLYNLLKNDTILAILSGSAKIAEKRCHDILDLYYLRVLKKDLGDHYLRINNRIEPSHMSMDDLSKRQLEALKQYGLSWGEIPVF